MDWNDTVGDHLFDEVPDMNLDLAEATFRHLLSHHAGQPRDIPHERFGQFGQRPEDPIADRLDWVTIALASRSTASCGAKATARTGPAAPHEP